MALGAEARSSGSSASVSLTWASKLIAIVRRTFSIAAVGEARAPRGAGVVDEQVEPPVALEHVLADARGRVLVEQVDGEEADALLAQLERERAQALLAAGDEHERGGGLAREPAGGGLADAAGGAGDEHDARTMSGSCWAGALRMPVSLSDRQHDELSHIQRRRAASPPAGTTRLASARRSSCFVACRGATTRCRRR